MNSFGIGIVGMPGKGIERTGRLKIGMLGTPGS